MKTVLIVEDNKVFGQKLTEYLIRNKYYVSYCDNSENAKLKLMTSKFDFILIDLMLPPTFQQEGINLFRYILEKKMKAEVIFMTTKESNTVEIVAEAMNLGAKDFLDKNFVTFFDKILFTMKSKQSPKQNIAKHSIFISIGIYLMLFIILASFLILLTYMITRLGLPFLSTFIVLTSITLSVFVVIIASQLLNDEKIKEETWLKVLQSRITNLPEKLIGLLTKSNLNK